MTKKIANATARTAAVSACSQNPKAVVGEKHHGQHGAGPGDRRDRQRIDGERAEAAGGDVVEGVTGRRRTDGHLDLVEEQQNSAGDLKYPQRNADLDEQELAEDDEE